MPERRLFVVAAALVAWFSVLLQAVLTVTHALEHGETIAAGLVNYFGYFTVITNLLVCAALTAPAVAPKSKMARFFDLPFARGGVAASIAFVSLAYHVLLRKMWHPEGLQLLADTLLHYGVPALYLAYWFIRVRDGAALRWADPLSWSVYPTAYFAYALVRGEIIGRYPYAFIDVSAIGYPQTLVNAVVLLAVFVVVGAALVAVARLGRRVPP